MSKSVDDIREELSALIGDAVPEDDPERRQALLVLADHWADILRRRADDHGGGRPHPGA
ncbi:hypothetical protein [Brevundimonas viscosa]|uniref:Uncharacterized protein n=1 Tax=Brevundimonas viscosa TaxID=871741 RepID=A0A1I6TCV7_9CAUL|nr:hypothetical protein [Brevundimonas viscosa]SFS87010.1 hypothetical protein SAMN05192570_3133 [Brevundimonas viscosa]